MCDLEERDLSWFLAPTVPINFTNESASGVRYGFGLEYVTFVGKQNKDFV